VSKDRTLSIKQGGSLSIASGITVTINGSFDAGNYKCFGTVGTVLFGNGAVEEVNPLWFGAVGDGVVDDALALQAAFDSYRVIRFPVGNFKTSATIALSLNGAYRISGANEGGGGSTGTIISYTPTSGTLFKLGTFDINPDYTSTPANAGTVFENMYLQGSYVIAAPASNTCAGIVDYECGRLRFKNVSINRFKYGFVGYYSDLNSYDSSLFFQCDIGCWLQLGSDQQTFNNCEFILCNIGTKLTAVKTALFAGCTWNLHYISAVDIELHAGDQHTPVITDIISGSAYTPGVGTYQFCNNITFDTCWFELQFPGTDYTRDQFVRIGLGTTPNGQAVNAVQFFNTYIAMTQQIKTAQAFITTGYATDIEVDGIYYSGAWAFPVFAPTVVNTYESGAYTDAKHAYGSGLIVKNVKYPLSYLPSNNKFDRPAGFGGGIMPPVTSGSHGGASVISNPSLRGVGFGWTATDLTPSAYELLAGENSLGGSPVKLLPTAQYGSLIIPNVPLENYTEYELVLRAKIVTGSDAKFFTCSVFRDINVVANTGQVYGGWVGLGDTGGIFKEFRWKVVINDEAIHASLSNRRMGLSYRGIPTGAEYMVVDYFDLVKQGPVMSDLRGMRRECWGAAAPTAGTWYQGDVVRNNTPLPSGTMGWVCTTPGTPGIWKTFGTIAA
jgi:hypothetical protein